MCSDNAGDGKPGKRRCKDFAVMQPVFAWAGFVCATSAQYLQSHYNTAHPFLNIIPRSRQFVMVEASSFVLILYAVLSSQSESESGEHVFSRDKISKSI